MRAIIVIIFAIMCIGTCTSCAATKKIPPVYEDANCSVTVTPGKIKIKFNK